jgi:hypothetical protein
MADTGAFTVLTLNVGGFVSRIGEVIKIFESVKFYHLITFQEPHFSNKRDSSFFDSIFEKNFTIFHSYAVNRYSGICILLNKSFIFGNHTHFLNRRTMFMYKVNFLSNKFFNCIDIRSCKTRRKSVLF